MLADSIDERRRRIPRGLRDGHWTHVNGYVCGGVRGCGCEGEFVSGERRRSISREGGSRVLDLVSPQTAG